MCMLGLRGLWVDCRYSSTEILLCKSFGFCLCFDGCVLLPLIYLYIILALVVCTVGSTGKISCCVVSAIYKRSWTDAFCVITTYHLQYKHRRRPRTADPNISTCSSFVKQTTRTSKSPDMESPRKEKIILIITMLCVRTTSVAGSRRDATASVSGHNDILTPVSHALRRQRFLSKSVGKDQLTS